MCAVKFAYVGANLSDLKVFDIEEKSYSPDAKVLNMTEDIFQRVPAIKEIATVCTLNNKSDIVYEGGKFNKQGEPTEAALKVAAEKLGQYDREFKKPDYTKSPNAYSQHLKETIKTVAALDFTSERKTMSTVVTGLEAGNRNTLLLKGAPERVIEKSKNYKREDGTLQEFTETEKQRIIDQIQKFAKEGLRVLGVGVMYGAG